jgi:hypothetical protein
MRPRGIELAVFLLPCFAAGPAPAQSPETVATRKRPEIDPLGLRLGAFRLDASVAGGYLYNDNVFAIDANEVDDNVLAIRPEVVLASDWSRHALRIGADADLARYDQYDSEDYDDTHVFADGRVDLGRGSLSGALGYSDLHEPRSSPDDRGGDEPTTYGLTAASAEWVFRPGALLVKPAVRYQSFSYDDTPASGFPSGVIDNADRDRDELYGGLRVGYELATNYDAFVEARATSVEYDLKADFDGFERSSDGYELVAGSTFDLGGKTFGEIYAGYRRWSYDDPRFENIDGLTFGLDLTWNATPLTTLAVLGSSSIESTTIVGAAGIQRTAVSLHVDHELLRNLILWAMVSAAREDFHGIDRVDDLREAALGAKYLMNRRLYLLLQADTERRDSSGEQVGQSYKINTVDLSLRWNL